MFWVFIISHSWHEAHGTNAIKSRATLASGDIDSKLCWML